MAENYSNSPIEENSRGDESRFNDSHLSFDQFDSLEKELYHNKVRVSTDLGRITLLHKVFAFVTFTMIGVVIFVGFFAFLKAESILVNSSAVTQSQADYTKTDIEQNAIANSIDNLAKVVEKLPQEITKKQFRANTQKQSQANDVNTVILRPDTELIRVIERFAPPLNPTEMISKMPLDTVGRGLINKRLTNIESALKELQDSQKARRLNFRDSILFNLIKNTKIRVRSNGFK